MATRSGVNTHGLRCGSFNVEAGRATIREGENMIYGGGLLTLILIIIILIILF